MLKRTATWRVGWGRQHERATQRWHPVQRCSSVTAVMELDTHPGPPLHDASGIGALTLGGLLTVQRTKFPDHEALIGGCP
jgi:hypothetical protein